MRLILKYTRDCSIKYISHLDIMRTFQRILRRAELPVVYSQGFNQHMNVAFATATSVGLTSECEYIDIALSSSELSVEETISLLNRFTCPGIRFISGKYVDDRYPALMASVAASEYVISLNLEAEKIKEAVSNAENAKELFVMKRTKSGVKLTDIRPMILRQIPEGTNVHIRLATGSVANLNPKLYVESIFKDMDVNYSVHRTGLFDINDRDMFSLYGEN